MRFIASLILTGSFLLPAVALAAPMHVNVYEQKTALVNNVKRNRAMIEARVKLAHTVAGKTSTGSVAVNMIAIDEHVKQYDCYNKINPAACRPAKQ